MRPRSKFDRMVLARSVEDRYLRADADILEDRLPKFEHIVFHEKLGTQAERIARIEKLAAELAPLVGADVAKAKRGLNGRNMFVGLVGTMVITVGSLFSGGCANQKDDQIA